MKLVHVITRLTLGGAARNTLDSAEAAARAGYDVLVVTGPPSGELELPALPPTAPYRLEVLPSLGRDIVLTRDLRAAFDLARLFRREKPQIVHTHTSKAGFLGRIAARLAGVPAAVHTPHGHIFYAYYGRIPTGFFVRLERALAGLSDRIVALTELGIEEHLARRIGRRDQWVAIPSGVDLASLRAAAPRREVARRELGVAADEPVLVGVGRLVPVKGFDLLLHALPAIASEHPRCRLFLVGEGPERASLERIAAAARVGDRWSISGPTDRVPRYLAAADLLVAPSRNEGMGRALVEAMALGLPIVATRVGGIPSVVSEGECGVLVPPEDPAALARAIRDLLSDAHRRDRLGRRGRERAEDFSRNRMELRLLELYRELAVEKGITSPSTGSETRPLAEARPSGARSP